MTDLAIWLRSETVGPHGIERLLTRCAMSLCRGQSAMGSACWEAYINHPNRKTAEYAEAVSYNIIQGDYEKAADVVAYGLIPFLRKLS